MKAVNPRYVVISVGKNSYGHPAKRVLELISSVGTGRDLSLQNKIQILRTDEVSCLRPSGFGEPRGDIVFECEKECVLKQ
jgi:beta-lactamase superfamily II metal-dependent hydrolase